MSGLTQRSMPQSGLETRAAFSSNAGGVVFWVRSALPRLNDSPQSDQDGRSGEETDVSTATLTRIFEGNARACKINHLSIDTKRFGPGILNVRHQPLQSRLPYKRAQLRKRKHTGIRGHMKSAGCLYLDSGVPVGRLTYPSSVS